MTGKLGPRLSEGEDDKLLEVFIQKERQLQFTKRRMIFLRAMIGMGFCEISLKLQSASPKINHIVYMSLNQQINNIFIP